MKAQRQSPDSVVAVVAQPISPFALLRGTGARLAYGVGCASVAGMKTRPTTGGAATGVVQPALSALMVIGVAGKGLASGVRCAKVAGMNRRAVTQNTGGGAS